MKSYDSLHDMRNDLIDYVMSNPNIDQETSDKIKGAVSMDLMKIGEFMNFVYDQDERDNDLAQIAAGAAGVFAMSGFLALGDGAAWGDNRAMKLRLALLRDAGVKAPTGMKWPSKDSDPAKTAKPAEVAPLAAPTPEA